MLYTCQIHYSPVQTEGADRQNLNRSISINSITVPGLTSSSGANEKNPSFDNSANHSTTGAHLNSHKDHMEILSPSKYKIQFTASDEFKEKLQKVQDLMRHQCQNGDLEKIFGKALDLLLESELKNKTGKALKPRNIKMKAKNTRSIPAEVKRKVWQRDYGQCQFKSASGKHGEILNNFGQNTIFAR